jgi:hypothetical protein
VAEDRELLVERSEVLADSLLGLLPKNRVNEKRKVLLAALLSREWQTKEHVELHDVVRAVLNPPARIGALDVESWMPGRERKRFAQELNTLIGSPRFGLWNSGAPIDFDAFCDKGEMRGRVNIISIAHLSETERHFIVSLILSEAISWMRKQSGTHELRCLLYQDECSGYVPPLGMPAPKRSFLTLLKQSRAYGMGVVLATQNPVDIDYKAMSNAGMWIIGRLTTERDRKRLVDGLRSSDHSVGMDAKQLHATVAALGKREFFCHSMYRAPTVMRSRHTVSCERLQNRLQQIEVAGQEQVQILERLRARRPGGITLSSVLMFLLGGRFGRMQAARQIQKQNPKLELEIREAEERLQAFARECDAIVAEIEQLAADFSREREMVR